jgi:hypothetical protein
MESSNTQLQQDSYSFEIWIMFILTLAIIAFQFGRNYNKISETVRGIISEIRPADRDPLK